MTLRSSLFFLIVYGLLVIIEHGTRLERLLQDHSQSEEIGPESKIQSQTTLVLTQDRTRRAFETTAQQDQTDLDETSLQRPQLHCQDFRSNVDYKTGLMEMRPMHDCQSGLSWLLPRMWGQEAEIRRPAFQCRRSSNILLRQLAATTDMELERVGNSTAAHSSENTQMESTAIQIGFKRSQRRPKRRTKRQDKEGKRQGKRQRTERQGACMESALESLNNYRASSRTCTSVPRTGPPEAVAHCSEEVLGQPPRRCAEHPAGCQHQEHADFHHAGSQCGEGLWKSETESPAGPCCKTRSSRELEELPCRGGHKMGRVCRELPIRRWNFSPKHQGGTERPEPSQTGLEQLQAEHGSQGGIGDHRFVGRRNDRHRCHSSNRLGIHEHHAPDPEEASRRVCSSGRGCERRQEKKKEHRGLSLCRWKGLWAAFYIGRQVATHQCAWQWPDSLQGNLNLKWLHSRVNDEDFQSPWAASWAAFLNAGYDQDPCHRSQSPPHSTLRTTSKTGRQVKFEEQIELKIWDEDFPNLAVSTSMPHQAILAWPLKPWSLRPTAIGPEVNLSEGTPEFDQYPKAPGFHPPGASQSSQSEHADRSQTLAQLYQPDDSASPWIHEVWRRIFIPQAHQPQWTTFDPIGIELISWYLDSDQHTDCESFRCLQLPAEWWTWNRLIRLTWRDRIKDSYYGIHIVHPEPPREQGDLRDHQAHLIIEQISNQDAAALLTLVNYRDGRKHMRQQASAVPPFANKHDVMHRFPGVPNTRVDFYLVFHDDLIFTEDFTRVRHGDSIEIHCDPNYPWHEMDEMYLMSTGPPTLLDRALPRAIVNNEEAVQQDSDDEQPESQVPKEEDDSGVSIESTDEWRSSVIYSLSKPALTGRTVWTDHDYLHRSIADIMEISRHDLQAAYPVTHGPKDLHDHHTQAFVVMLHWDVKPGEHLRLTLLDVEFYPSQTLQQPEVVREARLLPTQVTYKQLLSFLGLSKFCERTTIQGCLFWINGEIQQTQHPGFRYLNNGDYIRLALPPEPEVPEHIPTRLAAALCHQGQTFNDIVIWDETTGLDWDLQFTLPLQGQRPRQDNDENLLMQKPTAASSAECPHSEDDKAPNSSLLEELQTQDTDRTWIRALFSEWYAANKEDTDSESYVMTWYLDHQRFTTMTEARPVKLPPDIADWTRQIVAAWDDLLDRDVPFLIHQVHPQPPSARRSSPQPLAHLIITQHKDSIKASVLVSISNREQEPWIETEFATVVNELTFPETVFEAIGLEHRCKEWAEDLRCELLCDSKQRKIGRPFPIDIGMLIEVTAYKHSPIEQRDESTDITSWFQCKQENHQASAARKPLADITNTCDAPHSFAKRAKTQEQPEFSSTRRATNSRQQQDFHDMPLFEQRLHNIGQARVLFQERPNLPELLIHTWYLDHHRVPKQLWSRHVYLGRDPTTWRHRILAAWSDIAQPGRPTFYHIVHPGPRNDFGGIDIHVLVTQNPIEGLASILITTEFPGIAAGWRNSVAIAHSRITHTQELFDVADCADLNLGAYRCHETSIGYTTMSPNRVYPIDDGDHVTITTQPQRPSEDNSPTVSGTLSFEIEEPHDEHTSLQLLQHQTKKRPTKPAKLRLNDDPAEIIRLHREDNQREANHRQIEAWQQLPPALQELHDLLHTTQTAEHDEDLTREVITWFLDPSTCTTCSTPRRMELSEDFDRWTGDIHFIWRDHIEQGGFLSIYIVRPQPDELERRAIAHIIIVQNETPLSPASLQTTIHTPHHRGGRTRRASLLQPLITYEALLHNAGLLQTCEAGQTTCTCWTGWRQITSGQPLQAYNGISITTWVQHNEPREATRLILDELIPIPRAIEIVPGPGIKSAPSYIELTTQSTTTDIQQELLTWGLTCELTTFGTHDKIFIWDKQASSEKEEIYYLYANEDDSQENGTFLRESNHRLQELDHMRFIYTKGHQKAAITAQTWPSEKVCLIIFTETTGQLFKEQKHRETSQWPRQQHSRPRTQNLPCQNTSGDKPICNLHAEQTTANIRWLLNSSKDTLFHDTSYLKLSEEVQKAIDDCVELEDFDRYVIYTDGSSHAVDRRARPDTGDPDELVDTWAFIVLGEKYATEHDPRLLTFIGWTSHPVLYGEQQPHWLGADRYGSDIAEKEALFWAGLWRLGTPDNRPTVYRPDSLTAMHQAQGHYGTSNQDQSFYALRGIFQALEALLPGDGLLMAHTKGHAGDPWNEMVDQLAKQEAKKSFYCHRHPINLREWQTTIPYLWLFLDPTAGMPPLTEHGFSAGPPELPRQTEEKQTKHTSDTTKQKTQKFSISMATANVLSLAKGPTGHGGKTDYVRQQFIAHRLNLMGLQETRTEAGSSCTQDVLRLASGCQQGQYGIELWLNLAQPIAYKGKTPVYIRKGQCQVLRADPRYMIVKIQTPGHECLVAVLHAPQSGRPHAEREQWWNNVTDEIHNTRDNLFTSSLTQMQQAGQPMAHMSLTRMTTSQQTQNSSDNSCGNIPSACPRPARCTQVT